MGRERRSVPVLDVADPGAMAPSRHGASKRPAHWAAVAAATRIGGVEVAPGAAGTIGALAQGRTSVLPDALAVFSFLAAGARSRGLVTGTTTALFSGKGAAVAEGMSGLRGGRGVVDRR